MGAGGDSFGHGDDEVDVNMFVYSSQPVGTCVVTSEVIAYRSLDGHPNASVNEHFTVKHTFIFKTGTKSSIKAPKTVKKGKTVKLSGSATALTGYKNSTRNINSKAKVKIQAKVKGKWKTVKTVTTSKRGNWSYKVKPKKSTTYRAVHVKSKYYGKSTSKAVTVKVKR